MHPFAGDLRARILRLPEDSATCLAFFTRLPVRSGSPEEFDLARSAGAWPLTGALLGAGAALVVTAAGLVGFPPPISAILAVTLLILATGGLHEDGLADTADGLGSGGTPERIREIMRDSRLGTFGGLALLLVTLARIAALSGLAALPGRAALALIAAGLISRTLAIWHWRALPPAWSDGLARRAGQPDAAALALAAIFGGIAALVAVLFTGAAGVLACAGAGLSVWWLTRIAARRIGGHSGDTIGAAQQLAEVALLAGFSVGIAPAIG